MLGLYSKEVFVSSLCKEAGVSRQSYYQGRRRYDSYSNKVQKVVDKVSSIRIIHPRMGGRKLLEKTRDLLKEYGIKIGRDKYFDILRANNLLVKKRRNYHRTTNSYHHFYKYKNIIKDIKINEPNSVWVSDLTYIRTYEGFLYLSLISDAYSRKIIGYEVSDNLETVGCLKALKMAIREFPGGKSPIHHSDRGVQYCSKLYVNVLKGEKIKISMTEENHCYENAIAERINGILKDEYYLGIKFKKKSHAKSACKQAINLYNTDRPHLSLKMRTPDEIYYSSLKRSYEC